MRGDDEMYISIGRNDKRKGINDIFLARADSLEDALFKIREWISELDIDMKAVDIITYGDDCPILKNIVVYTQKSIYDDYLDEGALHFLIRVNGFPALQAMPDNPDKVFFSQADIEFYNRYNKSLGGHLDRIAKGEWVMCHW